MRGRVRIGLAMVIGGGGLALGVFTLWILGSASPAQADSACTINWVGPSTGGPWATASNWSTGQTPGTGDVVCISGVTGTVTFDGSGDTSTTLISELRSSAPLAITGGEARADGRCGHWQHRRRLLDVGRPAR